MKAIANIRLDGTSGQTLVEYALLLALIALFAVGGLELIGGPNPGFFSRVGSMIGSP